MEVVVAVAILGVAVVALIQLFSASLRAVKKSDDYSTALVYARSMLDEAVSAAGVSGLEGSFDLGEGFTARRTVAQVSPEEEGGAERYEITVTVMWPPSGRLTLKTTRSAREAPR
ncbi:MAG: hypothetical protein Kow0025_05750 [Thermodesulfovibrionales bacterium]